MSNFSKTIRAILVAIVFVVLGILIWNADILIRGYRSLQKGSFSVERLRFDLASFNLGRESSVVPIDAKISEIDSMTQLYIPEGEFNMGDISRKEDVDSPFHAVYLYGFWIDKVEVTNTMYAGCVQAGACSPPFAEGNPYFGKWVYRDYPVVYVNWFQASEYCEWAGRRLPTEAEWEKAARGSDSRNYPWGDSLPNPRLANFADTLIGESVPAYRYPIGASPYGALNMAGNVREWVADWFGPNYYETSPYMNPTGPTTGTERSLRSGAYDAQGNEILVTNRYKHSPESAGLSRGFRWAENGE